MDFLSHHASLALTIFLFGSPLTALYTKDPGALLPPYPSFCSPYLERLWTAGTVIYTAVWQGLGNARLPFYATTIGMWVIRIGSGYLMGVSLGWGLPGIWAGTLLDNGFRWIFLKNTLSSDMEGIKCMTRAFIWDLDGTLLDSYEAILDGIAETYAHYSLGFDREAVHSFILQQSVQALLEEVAREHGLDAEEMNRYRASSLREKKMPKCI